MSFQSLPFDITRLAVDYLVKPYSLVVNNKRVNDLGLLHCCHNWRVAFMSAAFKTLLFEFIHLRPPRFRFNACPDFIKPLDYVPVTPVRELELFCNKWDFALHGDLLDWIKKSGYAEVDFSYVRCLTIDCLFTHESTHETGPDCNITAQHISQFLMQIECMFPALTTIKINRFTVRDLESNAVLVRSVADKVLNLINGVANLFLNLDDIFQFSGNVNVSGISELTSFECRLVLQCELYANIIQQNSQTLRRLRINDIQRQFTHRILYSADGGQPTPFRSLESLFLNSSLISNSLFSDHLDLPQVLPSHFPGLKWLKIAGLYPFKNNIIACLSGKMEYIYIRLPTEPAALAMHSLASLSFFHNLKNLTIAEVVSGGLFNDSLKSQRDKDFITIVKSICCSASNMHRLEISYPVKKSIFVEYLIAAPSFTDLQILKIGQTTLALPDFIIILQKISSLRTLECSLDEDPPNLAGIRSADLPDHMYSKYRPLGNFFEKLIISNTTANVVKLHTRTFVLLAIACPRLSQIDFPIRNPARIVNMIQDLLSTESYKKHMYLVKPLLRKLQARIN